MNTAHLSIALALALAFIPAAAQPPTNASEPTSQQVAQRPGSAFSPSRKAKRTSKRASDAALPVGDVTSQEVSAHPGAASAPDKLSKSAPRKAVSPSPLAFPDDPANANVQPHAGAASRPAH